MQGRADHCERSGYTKNHGACSSKNINHFFLNRKGQFQASCNERRKLPGIKETLSEEEMTRSFYLWIKTF